MSSAPGLATAQGTTAYHARHPATGPHAVGAHALGDLSLSPVGLGTYLGHDDDQTDALYHSATLSALAGGINVLDTASNYRSQRSERTLGAAIREAIGAGLIAREELLVTSKVGYIPFDGSRPRHLGPYIEERYLKTGIIRREELAGGMHCMAPRYIDHVLDASRANLGLATIDVYYLHNPESGLDGVERSLWTSRVRTAFETLERAARDGRIGCYGTATWAGYRKGPEAPEHLGLEALVALAREVGGDGHHLRVVQLPVSLAMIEAISTPTQPSAAASSDPAHSTLRPLLEVARDHGLCVMSSASILQGQLTRGLGEELRAAIDAQRSTHVSPLASPWNDAQRSIHFARSAPGIATALVGMKQEEHVAQATAVMREAPMSEAAVRSLLADFGD